jgi:hypothetical protein
MSLRSSKKKLPNDPSVVPTIGESDAKEPGPSLAASIPYSAADAGGKANNHDGSEKSDIWDWAGEYGDRGSEKGANTLDDPNLPVPVQSRYWEGKGFKSRKDFDSAMDSWLGDPDEVRATSNINPSSLKPATASTNTVSSVDKIADQGELEDAPTGSSHVVLPSIETDDGPKRRGHGLDRGRRSRGSSGRGRLGNEGSAAGSSRRGKGRITKP